jgi:hypothetical protein
MQYKIVMVTSLQHKIEHKNTNLNQDVSSSGRMRPVKKGLNSTTDVNCSKSIKNISEYTKCAYFRFRNITVPHETISL